MLLGAYIDRMVDKMKFVVRKLTSEGQTYPMYAGQKGLG